MVGIAEPSTIDRRVVAGSLDRLAQELAAVPCKSVTVPAIGQWQGPRR
jgi:hypothetical protein